MLATRFSSCRYGSYAKCTCDANLLVPIDAIKCLISERMLGGKESKPVSSAAACFHTDTAFDISSRPVDSAERNREHFTFKLKCRALRSTIDDEALAADVGRSRKT
jgi:hypothetical protein